MGVMAGVYSAESKMNPLPGAVDEATQIAKSFNALQVSATATGLAQLLNRELEKDYKPVGVDAFHFAGHGYFDQASTDNSMLYLSDGTPVSSMLFRTAKYGGEQQPLFFLNACMIGTGGTILNDMGGFPGNCLRGGFGGLIGAFWVVDDNAARNVAIEFWRRTLAADPPEPVARVLWDLRSKYQPTATAQTTYLAYVFYGHPRLALRRGAPGQMLPPEGTEQTATQVV
jgi:CHAT domain-containing protein